VRPGRRSSTTPGRDLAESLDVAQRLIQAAISASVPPDDYEVLGDRAASSDPHDDSPPVRWARNVTQRVRDFNVTLERRAQLGAAWAGFFHNYDVLLTPVTPTTAFVHTPGDVDEREIEVDGVRRPYADQFAWLQSVGGVHLPATVAPAGLAGSGRPVGVQVVGPLFGDRTTIAFAGLLGELTGGRAPPPGY